MSSHFQVLYVTYYQRVYASCLLILKNHAIAEEATQEAFIKAFECIHTLREPSKFGAWIASIATRIAINIYNRDKKVVLMDNQEVLDNFARRTYPIDDPVSYVEDMQISKELRLAINRLEPPLNQLIILKYYWELSDPEIAELLEIPLGTVKSSLYRAKKMLAKALPAINKDYLHVAGRG